VKDSPGVDFIACYDELTWQAVMTSLKLILPTSQLCGSHTVHATNYITRGILIIENDSIIRRKKSMTLAWDLLVTW